MQSITSIAIVVCIRGKNYQNVSVCWCGIVQIQQVALSSYGPLVSLAQNFLRLIFIFSPLARNQPLLAFERQESLPLIEAIRDLVVIFL